MSESQRWFLLAVGLVLAGFLYLLAPILTPFLVGALLAYLCDPVADRLEAVGCSRTASVLIVFSVLTVFSIIALVVFIPSLTQQLQVMIAQIPTLISLVETELFPWLETALGLDVTMFDLEMVKELLLKDWQKTSDIVARVMSGVTQSGLVIAGWLANMVLIPVVMFYLLRDWDVMIEKIRQLLPRNIESIVSTWATECDEVLGAFMKGQLLVMFALGVIYAFGLWVVGLDLALLVGMLAGLASIVPYMGFLVGIVAALVAGLLQFNDPIMLAWIVAVFAIGQALEGMLLTPLLVGDRIGLHPVAVIFSVLAGGQLFGFVGVLIALPVAAVVMVLLRHLHSGYTRSGLYTHPPREDSTLSK